jgi:hypothetical protein
LHISFELYNRNPVFDNGDLILCARPHRNSGPFGGDSGDLLDIGDWGEVLLNISDRIHNDVFFFQRRLEISAKVDASVRVATLRAC